MDECKPLRLGIQHVKGMLLFGPPGTGKTLIARQIGKMLNGKEPKIVNVRPHMLNLTFDLNGNCYHVLHDTAQSR